MESFAEGQSKHAAAGRSPGDASDSPVSSLSWPGLRGWLSLRGWPGWRAVIALLGGLILRLWMYKAFPQSDTDGQLYADMARNLLHHGKMAVTYAGGVPHLTLIRLPGYPLFMAACFAVFGDHNMLSVLVAQGAIEMVAVLLLADFVRRIADHRAGWNTLWLAALCPFTAIYTVAYLAESLTLSLMMTAIWSLERYLSAPSGSRRSRVALALFTLALSFAALLRPDGALVAVALWPALIFARQAGVRFASALRRALVCGLVMVSPFALWTLRNWHSFHVFEPLAPRYANDPDQSADPGWQHWVSTWCLDFASTYEIYWPVPGDTVDVTQLPNRAFDSPEQRAGTLAIFVDYNRTTVLTDALDARFAELARQRFDAHPWRTHLLLPIGRLADMALRPRVENLTIDLLWWRYDQHRAETRFSYCYGALNLVFYLLAFVGLMMRPRYWPFLLAYIVLRSLLLLTIEAPETRYTIEFYPILFVWAGLALQRLFRRRTTAVFGD